MAPAVNVIDVVELATLKNNRPRHIPVTRGQEYTGDVRCYAVRQRDTRAGQGLGKNILTDNAGGRVITENGADAAAGAVETLGVHRRGAARTCRYPAN